MKVGYVKLSMEERNTVSQETLAEDLGTEIIFVDDVSGNNTERCELTEMLKFEGECDTACIESIFIFARNAMDLLELTEKLNKQDVQFISQKENIDTSTPAGKFILAVLDAMVELERSYISQGQKVRADKVKKRGAYVGRPKITVLNFDEIYEDWKAKKMTAVKAAKILSVSIQTFYRRVREKERQY